MKHAIIFGLILLGCSFVCSDASGQSFGPYSVTGTGCTPPVSLTQRGTATYYIEGTWSGTMQPKVAITKFVNARATPANSQTAQATITANGAYFTSLSSYSDFTLCGNTITGTAVIYLNLSTAAH